MDAQATARIPRAFEAMPDPRRHNIRHKFLDIFTIALFAVLCGCDDWCAVAAYGRSKHAWLATFLELPNGIPSHDTFVERIESHLRTQPGAPPPPNMASATGWDDEDELRRMWVELSAEKRTILQFMWKNQDKMLTYKVMSANILLPKLPGDGREKDDMSEVTVKKHCKPMESARYSLIQRDGNGKRTSLQLTYRGVRLVKLHSGKEFS